MASTLYTTSALPETHMEFVPGPGIELRPLTLLDDTTNSSLRAETHSGATLREQWMHSLKEWGWEITACLCSLIGFCSMIVLLVAFDGKSQPAWPYGVTLNSAVSLLSTITKSLLLIPAAACISQSIWINYVKREYSLGILTTYDAASRGPWGAVQLLWALKSRRLVCLGAFLTILAVGIDPAVQQTIVVESRSVPTTLTATIARGRCYSQMRIMNTDSVFVAETSNAIPLEMSGLLNSGIYRGSRRSESLDVVPDCPTNSCIFPRFNSLAVCSSCENPTQKIEHNCFTTETSWKPGSYGKNVTQCTFSLPNGPRINQSTYDGPTIAASVDKMSYMRREAPNILQVSVLNASAGDLNTSAEAFRCSLSWCVKTYEAAVINGSFSEFEIQSQETWSFSRDYFAWVMNLSDPGEGNESQFAVSPEASEVISTYLAPRFTFSNSRYVDVQDDGDSDWFRFWADTTSNFSARAPPVANLWDTLQMIEAVGPHEMFSNIAKAITTYIRTDGNIQEPGISGIKANYGPAEPVTGTAWTSEIYIRIRWPWLTFLGFLLICTILFLILTIHQSSKYRVAAWKSEPLALMYHGLESNKEDGQYLESIEDMQKQSSNIKVRLRETDSGLRLSGTGA